MELLIKTSKPCKITLQEGIILKNKLPTGVIITDENLARVYPPLLMGRECIVIKSGEESKSLNTYFEILNRLKEPERIIALGGGVVGDLAGFVASTYKRGIPLIQIPTSLLAMVDSSLGGKTGVNLNEKKNYIGTIYQSEEVLIDTDFLNTLPADEFENGVAEIIKYAYLFNNPSLERLQNKLSPTDKDLQEIIFSCCKNKAEIVQQDELDRGLRHILNFGHTIGHAIELLYNLKHGRAISIGMVKEFELANKLGIIKEDVSTLKKALKANNLPVDFIKDTDYSKIIDIMKSDKKGELTFSFNRDSYSVKVSEEVIKSFFEEQKA